MTEIVTVDELPERTRKAKVSKFIGLIEEVKANAGKWCVIGRYGNHQTAGRQASILRKTFKGITFEWREVESKGVLYAKA